MPSVGMRRTRVFGVVKGVDGARVLRSGRRLWPESGHVKLRRSNDGDEWFRLINSKGNAGGHGGLSCKWAKAHDVSTKKIKLASIHPKEEAYEAKLLPKIMTDVSSAGYNQGGFGADRMFGNVYSRKKIRLDAQNLNSMEAGESSLGKRKCGIQFFRRQRMKRSDNEGSGIIQKFMVPRAILSIFVEISRSAGACFSGLIYSVLSYMKRSGLTAAQLSGFLLSEPICRVFAAHGVQFLQGHQSADSPGTFMFFKAMTSMPLLSVDFSALPRCFMAMHLGTLLRSTRQQTFLGYDSIDGDINVETLSDGEEDYIEEQYIPRPPQGLFSHPRTSVIKADHNKRKKALHPSIRASNMASHSMQCRNGLSSRGIQKKRSSLRRRRARNISLVGMYKLNGAFVSESNSAIKNGFVLSSLAYCNKDKSSPRSNFAGNLKEVKSNASELSSDVKSLCCTANVLVVESDKCCRIEGATVMLEISPSKEWFLVVKKGGLTRYTHKAEKIMRPCSCNRFTHAIMWTADDNSWKLEFPNRQDWFVFKDLYKACSDHNVQGPVKSIPVPGVWAVPGYANSNSVPFCRPESFISMKDDELSRAMAKKTANYDMDSDDEEWLNKLNNDVGAKSELYECISEDHFELMVDAFEKGLFSSPDDFSDEEAAVDQYLHLGEREVVEAVYTYWMKKRRQKRSFLIRVFRCHQPKRQPVIPRHFLHKRRRSFKRQPSLFARVRQPSTILQGTAAITSPRTAAVSSPRTAAVTSTGTAAVEPDTLDEQTIMIKVEEAKASAKRSIELALSKRQKAQLLMENAELATQKATMALRIAEAARVESIDVAASHFLD